MKLTLLGGGGVRSPLFVYSALMRAQALQLNELCLMDIDPLKLEVFGGISQMLVEQAHSPVKLSLTTSADEALTGADFVITSIRVGMEPARILDEHIALRHNLLGQETTGPGGFAMASRSIPALLEYAQRLAQLNPKAWMINFTNPAGLVTQALRDAGFERTVGICDSANAAQNMAAYWLEVQPAILRAEVFGLNHLSWGRRVWLGERDVLPNLLADPLFRANTHLNLFDADLILHLGMYLNEYLYYYYYPEQAVRMVQAAEETRGEEVLLLNHQLLSDLQKIDLRKNPDEARRIYTAYFAKRTATYMPFVRPENAVLPKVVKRHLTDEIDEGYAGVAFNLIQALQSGEPLYTALNVPNQGAIDCMQPGDVVEVSCRVDADGIHPLPIGAVPEGQELLMRSVKRYERLAAQAILTRSRVLAVDALMAHPLVQSYGLAKILVDEYLQAHAAYLGQWN